jgi:hypothetical protein
MPAWNGMFKPLMDMDNDLKPEGDSGPGEASPGSALKTTGQR